MTGFAYKEFKQNLMMLIGMLIFPALTSFVFCAWFINGIGIPSEDGETVKMSLMESIRQRQGQGMWLLFLCIGFVMAGFLQGTEFNTDEKKSFAYFVTSTPEGVRGYIRTKYELVFVMMMLTLFSVQLGDWVMTLVCAAYGVEWFSLAEPMIMLSFLQMLLRAIEIPFTIRFGVKNGSTIKMIMLVIMVIAFLIVLAVFTDYIGELFVSGTEKLSTLAKILLALFPVIAVGLYYLSYRLSVKLYLKGVERYDK